MLTRLPKTSADNRVVTEWIESPLLAQSTAGIENRRLLTVYVPEAASDPDRRFPVLYCLAPWTGAGRSQMGWEAFKESLPDRLNRLIASGAMEPCLVVCPDLFTWYGGSQYINSSCLGPHADHIVKELIPYVEANYPALKGAESRAVFGRSSGGFGALRLAMDYPGTFAGVACHSGDMGFELLYRRDLVELCYGLARYSGQVQTYCDAVRKLPKLGGKDVMILMLLGMAASYSPNPQSPHGFDLPIDPYTGEIDESVWARWRAHDPVERLEATQNALKELRCLYIDCGNRDQYHLHFSARQFRKRLERFGVAHHYFEFDDNHSGTAYRYDVSLPLFSRVLKHQT